VNWRNSAPRVAEVEGRDNSVILLDTSVVIDGMTGNRRLLPVLLRLSAQGENLVLCTMVLYEWLRGPRSPVELALQESLLPSEAALRFDATDATAECGIISLRVPRPEPRNRSGHSGLRDPS
jgi:hypothetical protein